MSWNTCSPQRVNEDGKGAREVVASGQASMFLLYTRQKLKARNLPPHYVKQMQ